MLPAASIESLSGTGVLDGSTIVAPACAPGGVRSIVRCSGPASGAVLDSLCAGVPPKRTRGLWAITIVLAPGTELPAGLVRCMAPSSATGQDTLDLLLPGNPHLCERVIARCCAVEGVRRAGPGEFSARACLMGKMTLDQAEGVAALIAAERQDEFDVAGQLALGHGGPRYAAWAERALTLRALVEAGVDFADQEDVVPITAAALRAQAAALADEIHAWAGVGEGTFTAGAAWSTRPLVVLAGPPNAGKSTLFNALLGRERSIVAPAAGTTRDALVEPLELPGGAACDLADLPGLQHLHSSSPEARLDRAAQDLASQTLARADVVLVCSTAGAGRGAAEVVLPPRAVRLDVQTKCDRAPALMPAGGLCVCALDGRGVGPLRAAIAGAVSKARAGAARAGVPARQGELLRAAGWSLRRAADLCQTDNRQTDTRRAQTCQPPGAELIAAHLRDAVTALDALAGLPESPGSVERVLGRVFGRFCIGK